MNRDKSVYNFASTRTAKRSVPADHLEYDTRRAMELGYGCRYGDYKADHPNTREEYERLTEGERKKPGTRNELTCQMCGGKFYKTTNVPQKYCSPECKERAKERTKSAYQKGKAAPRQPVTCPICGKEFMPGQTKKYCSIECGIKGARQNQANRRRRIKEEKEKCQ